MTEQTDSCKRIVPVLMLTDRAFSERMTAHICELCQNAGIDKKNSKLSTRSIINSVNAIIAKFVRNAIEKELNYWESIGEEPSHEEEYFAYDADLEIMPEDVYEFIYKTGTRHEQETK